jgi:Calcineurin-like phosphoesterase
MIRPGFRLSLAAAIVVAALLSHSIAHPARAATSSCAIEGVDRIVAIGDVHGAYDRLVAILTAAHVIDARQQWSGGKTHLVQVGDVVDRGPDSRKALDLLRRLESEAGRSGGAVHALLGNHEVMRMLGDLRFVTPGEDESFATAGSEETRRTFVQAAKPEERDRLLKETPLGEIEMRLAFGREGAYGKWLRTHDTVIKINGVLFVHGGLSLAAAAIPCDVINTTVRRELSEDIDKTRAAPLASLAAREDGPLFYRGLAQEPETFAPQVDEILAAQHARAIVVAHTVTRDARIGVRFAGKVLQIDTGMQPAYVQNGRASALEISQGVFSAIYEDRVDVLVGGPAPAAAATPAGAPVPRP